jgi:hypothetical protein
MNPTRGSPIERALWFIESHFGRDVTLAQIADVACVSPYHRRECLRRLWEFR